MVWVALQYVSNMTLLLSGILNGQLIDEEVSKKDLEAAVDA